jgi:hypothetical protein
VAGAACENCACNVLRGALCAVLMRDKLLSGMFDIDVLRHLIAGNREIGVTSSVIATNDELKGIPFADCSQPPRNDEHN